MKKIILIVLAFFLTSSSVLAQGNYPVDSGAPGRGITEGTPLGKDGITGLGGYQPEDYSDINSFSEKLEGILSTVIGVLTILGGIWFLVQFMIGGLNWAGAGGDSQKVEEARKKMTNAAVGLIAMIAAYSVTYIVGQILGFDILDLQTQISKLDPGGI